MEKEKLAEIVFKASQMRDSLNKVYRSVQICLNGHAQHCGDLPFDSQVHCTDCGARCIDRCNKCKKPIRGVRMRKIKTPMTYALSIVMRAAILIPG